MMLRISRLGAGRDSGPECFTTGGSFLAFGVCIFGFGSGGGKGGAGAIEDNSFNQETSNSIGKSLYLILSSLSPLGLLAMVFHCLALGSYFPKLRPFSLPSAVKMQTPRRARSFPPLAISWPNAPVKFLLVSLPGSPLHISLPASGLGLGFSSSIFSLSSSCSSSCFGWVFAGGVQVLEGGLTFFTRMCCCPA